MTGPFGARTRLAARLTPPRRPTSRDQLSTRPPLRRLDGSHPLAAGPHKATELADQGHQHTHHGEVGNIPSLWVDGWGTQSSSLTLARTHCQRHRPVVYRTLRSAHIISGPDLRSLPRHLPHRPHSPVVGEHSRHHSHQLEHFVDVNGRPQNVHFAPTHIIGRTALP